MDEEFELPGIVPWGRTATEYEQFFALGGLAPGSRILDCGGGPASFASEYARRGFRTVSADPLFAHPADLIERSFEKTVGPMMKGLERADYRFVWDYYGSPEALLG